MISYRCKMNPDNLATPLAASFGDVVSITVLSTIASAFFGRIEMESWILYITLGCYFLILPVWIYVVLKNKYTRNVLTSGWVPVLSALFISGFVLYFISNNCLAHLQKINVSRNIVPCRLLYILTQIRRISSRSSRRLVQWFRYLPTYHKWNRR